MSITDELREWAGRSLYYKERRDELTAIADRIDAAHEKGVRELNGYASDSVLLPLDADGVRIRLGDKLEWASGETFEVIGIGDGGTLFYMEGDHAEWTNAEGKRHIKPDSWERIIRDAIAEGFERTDVSAPCDVGNDELVERCRKLAGEA